MGVMCTHETGQASHSMSLLAPLRIHYGTCVYKLCVCISHVMRYMYIHIIYANLLLLISWLDVLYYTYSKGTYL